MDYSEIDLNSLKVFISVADSKSISSASKKLFISQPAVTNCIKKLEAILGGKLFIRTSKGAMLTTEGKMFYDYCVDAMKKINAWLNAFSKFANLSVGQIKIGSSSTIIRHMLIPFISYFSKKYPDIKISIHDGLSDQLIDMLNHDEVDLSIVNTPIENQENFDITTIVCTEDCFIAGKVMSILGIKWWTGQNLKIIHFCFKKDHQAIESFLKK